MYSSDNENISAVVLYRLFAEQNKVRLLKVLQETRVVPILALLPSITPEQRLLFLRGGATAVLEKACRDNELPAQAESLISLYMALNPEEGSSYSLAYSRLYHRLYAPSIDPGR